MDRILGLDLGTNSIGWAIIDRNEDNSCALVDKGVHIFQEGVAREKGNEKPAVQERTAARASRRHYFRRRLRKIELLKVLVKSGFCPYLPPEMLADWKLKKRYPMDPDFLSWQKTSEIDEKNPYHDRYIALTRKLDLTRISDRYLLGRALYHLNQRRGFLSGRKDSVQEAEDGKVKHAISDLTKEMQAAGCRYLGEYFYHLYNGGEKIRAKYTSREEHYRAEFNEICRVQNLPEQLYKELERAIFYQRPLKSQKSSVGTCPFEKGKPRCPMSHPSFEEFRMYQFLNSVRLRSLSDEGYRTLNDDEIASVLPLFFRKSKAHFSFEEIATKIAGKKNWSFRDDQAQTPYKFNYRGDLTVSGCPVIAAILSALDCKYSYDWADTLCSLYTKGVGKSKERIIDDIWHALFFFSDESLLSTWLCRNLQLDPKDAETLAKFPLPQGYSNISLKAIRKILPWLKQGYIYSHAVFYANVVNTLPEAVRSDQRKIETIMGNVRVILEDASVNRESSKYKEITDYLLSTGEEVHPEKLYQPSVMELYPKSLPDTHGVTRLQSPRTSAFKNPMALRALFRLRALINSLLEERLISPETKINIEFARGLNDANKRRAIEMFQRENEKARAVAKDTIEKELGIVPSDTDILKFLLWEEQGHRCLYTGEQIGITRFIGDGNVYDIEHTIPRSLGGDDSQANKTLCNNIFNRDKKGTKLPSELSNHAAILANVEFMKTRAEEYEKRVFAAKKAQRTATTKEMKDRAIQNVHLFKMRRDYWRSKYERFVMTSVPEGFTNRQGVDIGIIGKYARMYLNSVFPRIYVVKGATTADFRRAWGLQDQYSRKERVNHVHHCIDAITIACIGKKEYDQWKWYMERMDSFRFGKGPKPVFEKPWKTFTEDVLATSENLTVSHYSPDYIMKRGRKKLRERGRVIRNRNGEVMYCQGDTARRALHKDTYYGAILRDGERRFVVRKPLDSLEDKDIKNIVDDVVREKVTIAKERAGSLKTAIEKGIWMNEEKRIPIKKVRLFVPSIASPIELKAHRDQSDKDYKRSLYVANDSNYCMAVYCGSRPSFHLYTTMDAVKCQKEGNCNTWIPSVDEKGNPIRFVIKVGMMVLFYEDNPKELLTCSQSELSRRLYKITGMSSMIIQKKYSYGTVSLKFHQEARPDSELKSSNGVWRSDSDYRPVITLLHTQLSFLVEGIDFDLSISGKIVFKKG